MHLNHNFAIIPTLILLLAFSPMMALAGDWLNDAFRLIRAQPYIGTAFFNGLNTSSSKTLIQQNATINPAFDSIVQLIAEESNHQTIRFTLPSGNPDITKTLDNFI
jgi:hypothetical protein